MIRREAQYRLSARDRNDRVLFGFGFDVVDSFDEVYDWAKTRFTQDRRVERVDVHEARPEKWEGDRFVCGLGRAELAPYFQRQGWDVTEPVEGIVRIDEAHPAPPDDDML